MAITVVALFLVIERVLHCLMQTIEPKPWELKRQRAWLLEINGEPLEIFYIRRAFTALKFVGWLFVLARLMEWA